MLDLLIFALAIAVTRFISQKHPLLQQNDNISSKLNKATKYIFQVNLLISLLLFSLSILEVGAPLAYLVIIDRASLFVSWYRVLLWVQCIILLVVHPIFSGFILCSGLKFNSMMGTLAITTSSTSSVSPRNRTRNLSDPTQQQQDNSKYASKKKNAFVICLNILYITLRFILVSILWRLLFRKALLTIIPYRITLIAHGSHNNRIVQLQKLTAILFLASTVYYMTSHHIHLHLNIQLKYMVSTLCSLGMIIASILNGFGCASLPFSNLVGVFLKPTSSSVISKVEEDLLYAIKTCEEKRWMLSDLMNSSSNSQAQHTLDQQQPRIQHLTTEVEYLQTLIDDMQDDIYEMKHSQTLAINARAPFVGRIRGVLGVIFSIVLVVRVLLAANSFMVIFKQSKDEDPTVNHEEVQDDEEHGEDMEMKSSSSSSSSSFNKTRDPLTNILIYLVGQKIVDEEQYDLFRQATSLILAGILSISQVRAFFRVVGALSRRISRMCSGGSQPSSSLSSCVPQLATSAVGTMSTSSNKIPGSSGTSITNNMTLLLSSFVMGCYFLACVTVVKMNLPIEYRSSFSQAVGHNFIFNTTVLNMIFFTSTCVTAIILGSLFGIQRNNSSRYQLEESQFSNNLVSQSASSFSIPMV